MKKRTDTSEAKFNQQKHWETTGQLYRILGLARYMLEDRKMTPRVRQRVVAIRTLAAEAVEEEAKNNQFINLRLPRGF